MSTMNKIRLSGETQSDKTNAQIFTVAGLYLYLDNLFDQDVDADILFASGYLRGFISLAATRYGNDDQAITKELIEATTLRLNQAKTELSPQDHVIVINFWLQLQSLCNDN